MAVFFSVGQQWFLVGIVGVALLLLLVLLCYAEGIDERERLEKEVKELEDKGAEIDRRRDEINDRYTKMLSVMALWRYQTIPRLENFSELDLLIKDLPDRRLELLEGLADRMERIDTGMGSLKLWIGSEALEESLLKLSSEQMDA